MDNILSLKDTLLSVIMQDMLYYLSAFFLFSLISVQAADLNQSLQEKARQLQDIHNQLQAVQQNLSETEEKGRTLQGELRRIGGNIKQLNLGIKSSELTIDKLNLEINGLQKDISDLEKKINLRKEALTKLLRRFQEHDQEVVLMTLLKKKTLSESLAEVSGYSAINFQISQGIRELKNLQSQLNDKLSQTSDKKSDVERENRGLKTKKVIVLDEELERKNLLTRTKSQEKLYQQQISELEKQQLAIADEVEALERQLRAQTDPNTLPTARSGVLMWPVQGRLSQGWGATAFAKSKRGYRGKWHNGIDISAPIGTPIMAAERGVVLAVGDQDKYCRRGAYGKYIVIKHENNLTTLYGHLSQFAVSVGNIINRGDIIGYMGRTGYATGSHLHFTIYDAKTFGLRPSNSCGLMPSGGDLSPLSYL